MGRPVTVLGPVRAAIEADLRAGLGLDEIAATRGVGQRTVRRVRDAAGIAANPGVISLRRRARAAIEAAPGVLVDPAE